MKRGDKEGQGKKVEIGVHEYALDFIRILFSKAYRSETVRAVLSIVVVPFVMVIYGANGDYYSINHHGYVVLYLVGTLLWSELLWILSLSQEPQWAQGTNKTLGYHVQYACTLTVT